MSPQDILPSLIEVSIAVAGFSGIVAALSPVRPSDWGSVTRISFSILLSSTLICLSMTLLAMVLLASPLEAETAWVTVSGLHSAALLAVFLLRAYQMRRALAPTTATATFGRLVALNIVIVGFHIANVVYFRSGWACIAGLALYALFGFFVFIMLISSLWGASPSTPATDATKP